MRYQHVSGLLALAFALSACSSSEVRRELTSNRWYYDSGNPTAPNYTHGPMASIKLTTSQPDGSFTAVECRGGIHFQSNGFKEIVLVCDKSTRVPGEDQYTQPFFP